MNAYGSTGTLPNEWMSSIIPSFPNLVSPSPFQTSARFLSLLVSGRPWNAWYSHVSQTFLTVPTSFPIIRSVSTLTSTQDLFHLLQETFESKVATELYDPNVYSLMIGETPKPEQHGQ